MAERGETTTTKTEIKAEKEKKKSSNGSTIIAIIALAAFAAAVIFIAIMFSKNKKIKKELYAEKAKVETLTIEKARLEDVNNDLNGENIELDRSLDKVYKGMNARDIVIERLQIENKTLRQIKKELEEIKKITADLSANNEQLKNLHQRINKIIDSKQLKNEELRNKIK